MITTKEAAMRRTGGYLLASAVSLTIVFAGAAVASQGGPLSKPDYIEAADNICGQSNQLISEAEQEHLGAVPAGQDPTDEQLIAFVSDIEPIVTQETDSLRSLPAPKTDAKKLNKLYKLVDKGYQQLIDNPSLLLADEPPAPLAKAAKKAAAYGFNVCGT